MMLSTIKKTHDSPENRPIKPFMIKQNMNMLEDFESRVLDASFSLLDGDLEKATRIIDSVIWELQSLIWVTSDEKWLLTPIKRAGTQGKIARIRPVLRTIRARLERERSVGALHNLTRTAQSPIRR